MRKENNQEKVRKREAKDFVEVKERKRKMAYKPL